MHGIILRTTKVKDSDLVVNWLNDEDRLVATYAGHVQGSQRFPNALELMTVYEIDYSLKAGQTMGSLKSAYSTERFDHIIEDMNSLSCASAALEAVSNLCPDESTVIDLFPTLLQSLAVMNTAPELSAMILAWFECFLVYQLGVMPNLEMCSQCAQPLLKSSYYQQELGFICKKCAHNESNIPEFVLEAIRRLRYQSLRETVQKALAVNNESQRRKILAPVLKFLVSIMCDNSTMKRLKAHRFMAESALDMPDLFEL